MICGRAGGCRGAASTAAPPPSSSSSSSSSSSRIPGVSGSSADLVNRHTVVFGVPLPLAVRISRLLPDVEVPAVVHQCIEYLNEHGTVLRGEDARRGRGMLTAARETVAVACIAPALTEEGLYRVPGSTSKVNQLKAMYNRGAHEQARRHWSGPGLADSRPPGGRVRGPTALVGQVVDLAQESPDPSNVAGLLKLYFRELPDPILTRDVLQPLQEVVGMWRAPGARRAGSASSLASMLVVTRNLLPLEMPDDDPDRVAHLRGWVEQLPSCNYAVLYWMMRHLHLGRGGAPAPSTSGLHMPR